MNRAGIISPVDTSWIGMFQRVALSRDGTRAVVYEWTTNLSHLMVRDMASGSVAEVSLPNAMVGDAMFSFDSRTMYFQGGSGRAFLYRVDPSGAARAERVMQFPAVGLVNSMVFDPSGEYLYFSRDSGGADELVRMKLSGTQSEPAVAVPGGQRAFEPQISPDGKWLAYLSNASGRTEVHVRSTDLARSGDWRVATSADEYGKVRWSHGGDELFYTANGSLMAVPVKASPSFEPGVPRALFPIVGLNAGFEVGADGRFLMIRGRPDRRKPTTLVMLERWTDLLPPESKR